MPLSRYFDNPSNSKPGKGAAVLAEMRKRYGKKRGTAIFYATVNKQISKGSPAQKRAQPKRRPGEALSQARKKFRH